MSAPSSSESALASPKTARAGVAGLTAAMAAHATVARSTTLLLRLYLGSAFLNEARHKIGPGTWSGFITWMPTFIAQHVQHGTGPYIAFLRDVVVPHGALFAALVAIGETAVGIAMLLGVTTRAAAAVGIILTTNYMLLNGTSLTDVSNDRALLVGFIVVLLTAPGRVFGIDKYLARRWPRAILW
jgi:thiosulfate dehydrogenase [quinone] large subunit